MHLVSCNGKLQTNCREKSCRLIRPCLLVLPLFMSSYFRGLEAMIKGHRGSSCNELIFSHTATIESPGYPLYYPPLLNCVYTIRKYKPEVCQVKIYVNDFQLDNSNQCACDFLCVDSRRYCGRMLRPKQTLTLDFPYWKNKLFLNFHTNWIRWGKGFSLEIHQKTNCDPSPSNRVTTPHPPPFCNALLRHPEGIITSLGYPQKYSNNMDCTYRFVRNGGDTCWLELTFVDFSVQATQDCSGDYLEIGESRFCGEIMNRRVETPFAPGENYIDIKFITDNSATNRGFYLTYKLISCNDISSSTESSLITSPSTRDVTVTPHPPRCNYYLTQRTGNITSSGYPVSYSNNMDCTYTITKLGRDICWLKITFVDFSLQKSDDCTRDYLGINVDNRFCGNVKNNHVEMYPFPTKVSFINLKFITDNSATSRGFDLAYQLVRCDEFPSSTEAPHKITTAEYISSSFDPETTVESVTESTTISEVKSTTPETSVCEYLIRSAFQSDCQKYIDCTSGTPKIKACPTGQLFMEVVTENIRIAECRDEKEVNCEGRNRISKDLDIPDADE